MGKGGTASHLISRRAAGCLWRSASSKLAALVNTRHDTNLNPPIKLISTDFDGTLFAEFEMPPIPARIVTLIGDLQARGAKWVINTGRDMSSLMEALARARIGIQPDFLVLVEREIFIHDGMRYAGIPEWNEACSRDHAELYARVRPDVQKLYDWVNARFRATVYEDAFSPFCLIAGHNDDADQIHAHLLDYCRGIPNLTVVRNDVYARFCHTAYNKGTALTELALRLGIGSQEIFAAGDHLNDLPMLQTDRARWLAAPSNAVAEVKETVRRQQGFVSELSHGEGVADGLEFSLRTAGLEHLT
ncbi:MAG: HAD family phosphatase [Pedosphaera sp.]|nr:HAD family phosphatase [Pedosphaera sp.]